MEFGEIIRLSLSSTVTLSSTAILINNPISIPIGLACVGGALTIELVINKVRNYKKRYTSSEFAYVFQAKKCDLLDNRGLR